MIPTLRKLVVDALREEPPPPGALWWGGKPLPAEAATTHFFVVGATNSGKTVLLRLLMQQVLPRIVAGIVTYQSSWTPPFGDPLRDSLAGLGTDHQLDIGCALLHGAFEVHYPSPWEISLTAAEGSRSLVQFLLRLLKQLQSLATAPAIDYEAYLARFQADGGVTR